MNTTLEILKQTMKLQQVFAFPVFRKPFMVETDKRTMADGVVLDQEKENGKVDST